MKRREDWGPSEFFARSDKAWAEFAPTTGSWMTVEEHVGAEDISRVYASVLAGENAPDRGFALSF